ncbi:MAG TPA: TonB family protein [Mucilaginibacter sp.]
MIKFFVTIAFCLGLSSVVQAQSGSLIYYLTQSGKLVSTKDSADYWMLVDPPDTTVNKNLYVVHEYYKNGRVKLVTSSKTNDLNLLYQGPFIAYFPNGRRMRNGAFNGGDLVGVETSYYPNGKLYSIKRHNDNGLFLSQCSDSTGTILTQNGNGKWVEYDENFKDTIASGNVVNGLRDGEWRGRSDYYENYVRVYRKGQILSEKLSRRKLAPGEFAPADTLPQYPGGVEEFYKFLAKNIRYPNEARENKNQGKVIISFVVERDGTLTDFKVKQSVGGGCDEEAIRIIKLSAPWTPGMQNGKPVRVAYSVPIGFKTD